jgi:general stress protein YciG
MTEKVRALLERMVEYPIADSGNIDAISLQLLAAKALLKFNATKQPRIHGAAELGRNGGRARAEALSPEQRSEIARKGAQTRWQRAAEPETHETQDLLAKLRSRATSKA